MHLRPLFADLPMCFRVIALVECHGIRKLVASLKRKINGQLNKTFENARHRDSIVFCCFFFFRLFYHKEYLKKLH